MGGTLFWVLFTIVSVWVQFFIPGLDALAPGIIVSLQRDHWSRSFWLILVFLLVQEGVGSMAFGGVAMFYALLFAGFWLGRRLFDASSFLFMLLLGVWYGVVHVLGQYVLADLQDISLPGRSLLDEFVVQSLYFIAAWFIAHRLYGRKVVRHVRSL